MSNIEGYLNKKNLKQRAKSAIALALLTGTLASFASCETRDVNTKNDSSVEATTGIVDFSNDSSESLTSENRDIGSNEEFCSTENEQTKNNEFEEGHIHELGYKNIDKRYTIYDYINNKIPAGYNVGDYYNEGHVLYCPDCGYEDYDYGVQSHLFAPSKMATCVSEGTNTCIICGATRTVPKKAHREYTEVLNDAYKDWNRHYICSARKYNYNGVDYTGKDLIKKCYDCQETLVELEGYDVFHEPDPETIKKYKIWGIINTNKSQAECKYCNETIYKEPFGDWYTDFSK